MKSVGGPLRLMKFDLFKNNRYAKSFNQRIKVLRLYKDGEPTLNKKLPEMIEYAKKADVAKKLILLQMHHY